MALIEVTCVFHRHIREGSLTSAQGTELIDIFRSHVKTDIWNFLPVTDSILRTTARLVRGLPASIPLRAGDAIHIATVLDAGEPAISTNDRHVLTAAAWFGLAGQVSTDADEILCRDRAAAIDRVVRSRYASPQARL